VLNSINLEDGRERFDKVVPLALRYGAAVVVGTIDEQGMAVTVERKLEVARRSYELLVYEYGLHSEDIWWDPLVFPCATGDENYIGSARRTIDGVRALKDEFPLTRTILGISNVSFGLPKTGREVLNSLFLYHCTQAGLDAAIVNTQRLARYAEIPEAERRLADDLIYLDPADVDGSNAAIERFTEHFRGRKSAITGPPRAELPLEERIARSVVEGSKEGLREDLDVALADERWPVPLDIINGPLMTGMAEVGRLFNANELIVAEVLQSAEVMKAAVSHLEPHMDKAEGSSRGKIVLATVKGDVHDIGKNLVDIVLSNNGFEVVNLGIRVLSEQLIQAVREHQPDVLGLSGLLVKSAQQMVLTAGDLKLVDIDVPMLVGGAALSRRFTHKKIAPAYGSLCTYAKDAMHGLELVERLTDEAKRPRLEAEVEAQIAEDGQAPATPATELPEAGTTRSSRVRADVPSPQPPDLDRHIETFDLDEVWAEINPQMLYGKHLGLKGSVTRLAERGDRKLEKLERVVDELKEIARGGAMEAKGVWRFFPARGEANRIVIANGTSESGWELPRQRGTDGLCLSDYLGGSDHIAVFVTTAGAGVRELVEGWKQEGEYLKSHAYAALALESAEAAAELLHRRLRVDWGFPDPEETSLKDRLAARYRGKRYSFGYPACPDLAGQQLLFELLRPEDIGVELTEGDMMSPEASVSALVFHHPDARYFSV
jgi:5-methyltetrahydrofolate--homocysteine methyltransferase